MEDVIKFYESKKDTKNGYLKDLEKIIVESKGSLEGNCFYYHQTLVYFPELYTKQVNLVWCGQQGVSNICEIGFNAGHSAMLMLLGRKDPINFTIFDIGCHAYTKPCFEYIKSKFHHVNFEYIEGDSTETMQKWINSHKENIRKYDVVHVDGVHTEHCISNDMMNADLLVKVDGIIIVDDTNNPMINSYVDKYISTGRYKEVELLKTVGYSHRIIKRINMYLDYFLMPKI